eukprot:TRINITY_DN5083_c0_g1_i1.p1 TRINITY_DN5083_c0_g1~~TRINITY_DN5083_c0_g1_i1.p1  ORF type:complete len:436 (+),score=90.50 TRINITY_DN5083_c0_g1_i1:44-1309(+)
MERNRIEEELRRKDLEQRELQKRKKAISDEFQQKKYQMMGIDDIINQRDRELNRTISQKKPPNQTDIDAQLQELTDALEKQNSEMESLEEGIRTDEEQIEKLRSEKRPFVDQINEEAEQRQSAEQKSIQLDREVQQTQKRYLDAQDRLGKCGDLTRDALAKRSHLQSFKAKCERELAEITEKAKEVEEERQEVHETPNKIDAKILSIERSIAKQREGHKSPEEIERQYQESKANLETTKQILCNVLEDHRKLNEGFKARVKLFLEIRRSISLQTTLLFNHYLTSKGHSGSLMLDHDNSTLEIAITLDGNNSRSEQRVVSDTRSLSGGERSFSTVALLLALWQNIDSPFRAMDEFDVFMDAVNRKVSIKLLIDVAREQGAKQFIFITPHDPSVIGQGPDVRIHRLRDPERAQSTLDLGRTNQ